MTYIHTVTVPAAYPTAPHKRRCDYVSYTAYVQQWGNGFAYGVSGRGYYRDGTQR